MVSDDRPDNNPGDTLPQRTSISARPALLSRLLQLLRTQSGAFDLTSILTGAAVIGVLAGGVLVTVFGIIPYAQQVAAKQDLSAVSTGQGAAKVRDGRFMSNAGLSKTGYLSSTPSLAVATNDAGSCFVGVSSTPDGKAYLITDKTTDPVELSGSPNTGCVSDSAVYNMAATTGATVKPPAVMKTVWDTSIAPACSTLTLPLDGAVNATIDWGDGSPIETVTSPTPSHTYGTQGVVQVTINGTFDSWVGAGYPTWSKECLTQVTEWGDTGTTDIQYGFLYATNLTDVERVPSTATDWYCLFAGAPKFNGSIGDWDTSHVTNMGALFSGAQSFNQDISSWDTSNVTSMTSIFEYAVSFNQPLGTWNTSQVADLSYAFSSAHAFNQDIGSWNTAQATNMNGMFWEALAFNKPIDAWSTSNVMDMGGMFYGTTAFNQPLNSWNTSQVTNMWGLFLGGGFNQPLNRWDTSNVTNMNSAFKSTPFNSDISTWNTAKVQDMAEMFSNAASFNTDISRWNTASLTTTRFMFAYAPAFNSDLNGWDMADVTDASNMFTGASAFNKPLGSWNTTNMTTMSGMFTDAKAFNQPIGTWNTSKVTDMRGMFLRAFAFNQPLGSWNTANVYDMGIMFYDAKAFNQNISTWNVAKTYAGTKTDFSTGSPLQASYKPALR